ncbi:Protein of uncharacterised function (DUF3078) [Porphyromonas macacae]|uniref:Protein of uncharacterized function (DUF3078) n=1 Tax=Porphyromonas macacae TaxID=28115 RepID=A0A379EBG9_9PORP|nr:DUF3078 domain-containing protein [Porphyromonas macacae]SUB89702.1 Protein of uncharacterised function (DUF3078) [Porphyromonas macacae]
MKRFLLSVFILPVSIAGLTAQVNTEFSMPKQIKTLDDISKTPGKGYILKQKQYSEIDSTNFKSTMEDSIAKDYSSSNYLIHILRLPLVTRSIHKQQDPLKLRFDTIGSWQYEKIKVIEQPQISSFLGQRLIHHTLNNLQIHHSSLFKYGQKFLEQYRPDYRIIQYNKDEMSVLDKADSEFVLINSVNPLKVKETPIKHWFPSFETSIQFSQNFVSNNWHKGGASNLNLFIRNYFAYNYLSGEINWVNEIEHKLSIFNAMDDSVHRYRISDDLIRFHSNFGYKAFSNWYYTLDWDVRTQLFNGYKQNSRKLLSSIVSPINSVLGLGMKYEYKDMSRAIYGRKIKFTLNIAPFSYSVRTSLRDNIDLERHGLSKSNMIKHSLGSTIRSELLWDFNLTIGWRSRFIYNTNYKNVDSEWENTFNFNFNRFFSSKLYLHLRFDDSVPPSESWMKYLQINELISLGFNFKI